MATRVRKTALCSTTELLAKTLARMYEAGLEPATGASCNLPGIRQENVVALNGSSKKGRRDFAMTSSCSHRGIRPEKSVADKERPQRGIV